MSHLPVPQGSLAAYLAEINRFPLLSAGEERELATKYQDHHDVEAAHKLVTSNLRFVVKIAYEYSGYGVRLSDLIQEGNIGLMHAVKKYDPRKGFRLISYAVWWIRAYIQNFILKTWSLVKIGTTQAQRKLFYKLRKAKTKMASYFPGLENLNDEACEQLAKTLDVKSNDVIEMEARLRARDASLDQPIGKDGSATRLDFVATEANQEDQLVRAEESALVKSSVQKALTTLSDRERFIVENRLMSDEPITLQEVGDRYKISRERARQIEEAALKKIKNALGPRLRSLTPVGC
ncbi:MAG: RNA polymerase sigma factor RpoH [Deltaproteobacteria bacterium]|nr:RNA polymerase sigma factor RpoH [Deltaproteobacteria bacterium]